MRQIVLDTETTGLEPKYGHRVIEIGCVELVDRKFTGNNLQFYINPEREVEAGALKVHGITNHFLSSKPLFRDIYPEFLDYIKDAELIIHNAPFDVGFLNHEFRLVNRISHPLEYYCKIFDTLTFARELHPGQRNSLDALCKRYSIDNSDRNFHGALLDAKILAGVYLAMTGGQDLLFSDLPKANQQNDGAEQKALSLGKTWDLTLIHASIDEVKSHDDYLQSLSKKSDEVIWK